MSVIGQFITTLRNTAADCLNIHNDCRSGKYLTSRCIAAFKDRFNLFKAAVTWHIMMQTCIKIDFIFQNMQKVLIVFLEKIQVEQIVTSRLMTAILFNKFQQVFLGYVCWCGKSDKSLPNHNLDSLVPDRFLHC